MNCILSQSETLAMPRGTTKEVTWLAPEQDFKDISLESSFH